MQITHYLIAYFDRQDRAKGLSLPDFMARELTSYYHARQKKLVGELVTEAIRVGTLKGIHRKIKKLLRQAEKMQGDELRQIGARIEALYKQAKELSN